jgi:hypothetical protein
VFSEFLRRFGTGTFLQQLFPYYLDSLIVDYTQSEATLDDNSSTSSTAPENPMASAPAGDDDISKRSQADYVPRLGRVASEAFVGIW